MIREYSMGLYAIFVSWFFWLLIVAPSSYDIFEWSMFFALAVAVSGLAWIVLYVWYKSRTPILLYPVDFFGLMHAAVLPPIALMYALLH